MGGGTNCHCLALYRDMVSPSSAAHLPARLSIKRERWQLGAMVTEEIEPTLFRFRVDG